MQTLDILWFSVLSAVALLAGMSSREDSYFASGLSMVMSIIALGVAWPVVRWLYGWLKSVIPSPESGLHTFTALLMTGLITLAFVVFNLAFPAYVRSLVRRHRRRQWGQLELHKCASRSSA